MLHGKRTYGEFALLPGRIPTNILADGLERESAGIITSTPYLERPVRYAYTLTPKGERAGRGGARVCALGQTAHTRYVTLNQGPAGGEVPASATKSRRRGQSARDEAAATAVYSPRAAPEEEHAGACLR